jgi:hypothetical protein
MSDKLATSTINKVSYQLLTRRCGVLQSTPFKERNNLVGTTGQPVRLTLIPNVTARPNLPHIIRFGPYRPHRFVLGSHTWPQNASDKSPTSTTNKANYQLLTCRYRILHLWSHSNYWKIAFLHFFFKKKTGRKRSNTRACIFLILENTLIMLSHCFFMLKIFFDLIRIKAWIH